MKTGISTASFFQRLNNEDVLPLFSEWGVETAEVFLTSFSEYEPSFAKTLSAAKGGLDVYSVHALGTQFEPQLYGIHPRVKRDAYFWLKKVMRSAKALGAQYYTFHGLPRLKRTFKEDLPRVARGTEEIAAFCAAFGVRLCYENVEWAFFNRPEIFLSLKSGCPSLGGVLDIKQARIAGHPYEAYLNAMGQSLTHVHVSDWDGDKMCLPGEGRFDFDTLYKNLRDTGFRGAVMIENYANDYKDYGQMKRAYEFLKEKAQKYCL